MKIAIACSKPWFNISEKIRKNNKILFFKNKSDLNIENIENFNPDLIFFPHWSWIVPNQIHENYNCILFHTAPLPFGRGGSPIQNLILLGYDSSPVCALKMVNELDSGPIYGKKNLSLNGSLSEIFKRLNIIVNEFIEELIHFLPEPKNQTGEVFNFIRKNKEDNLIPSEVSLEDFYNRIRMLDDLSYPNSYIKYGNFIIEFNNAKLLNGEIICKAQIKYIS